MLKPFKKIQALLLALVLSLTLTACSEEVTNAIVDEVVDIAVSEVVDALTEEDASSEELPDSTEYPIIEGSDISAPGEDCPNEGENAPLEEVPEEEEARPAIDEDGSVRMRGLDGNVLSEMALKNGTE